MNQWCCGKTSGIMKKMQYPTLLHLQDGITCPIYSGFSDLMTNENINKINGYVTRHLN